MQTTTTGLQVQQLTAIESLVRGVMKEKKINFMGDMFPNLCPPPAPQPL